MPEHHITGNGAKAFACRSSTFNGISVLERDFSLFRMEFIAFQTGEQSCLQNQRKGAQQDD